MDAERERFLAGLPAALAGGARPDQLRLTLDPPVDARELARLWGIDRPVAVSTDVHQHSWWLLVAGEPLPDPYGPRIAAESPRAGAWTLRIELDGRPSGPLPGVVCGASPAYDVNERGGQVVAVEIVPAQD
jgi:hypothetical protein